MTKKEEKKKEEHPFWTTKAGRGNSEAEKGLKRYRDSDGGVIIHVEDEEVSLAAGML